MSAIDTLDPQDRLDLWAGRKARANQKRTDATREIQGILDWFRFNIASLGTEDAEAIRPFWRQNIAQLGQLLEDQIEAHDTARAAHEATRRAEDDLVAARAARTELAIEENQ